MNPGELKRLAAAEPPVVIPVVVVAVSEDGTKIVRADAVIVVGVAMESLFHYDANKALFRQEKILRAPNLLRRGQWEVVHGTGREVLSECDQALVSGGKGIGGCVLITRAKFVPGGSRQLIGPL